MQKVNRIEPALPVTSVQTFQVQAPVSTHFRPATCAEVDCPYHVNGWATPVDEGSELGKTQAHYIRNGSGRRYTEDRNQQPGLTVFVFEAGQTCFNAAAHRAPLGRPPIFLVKDGDWRGNPTGRVRQHANADDWVDQFAHHQAALADEIQKG